MPAEWEPHAATWLSWPHKEESWPRKFASIPAIFVEIVRLLSPYEEVDINVNDAAMEESVKELLVLRGVSLETVRLRRIPTNDAWCRDHGPVFVVSDRGDSKRLAGVDWVFNAWGGKYPPYDDDDAVPTRIAEELKVPIFYPGIVMEGGAVDFNGAGAVLTTESCLLNKNRNPKLSKKRIEQYLKDYYGQTHVCWLGDGIAGDDTDGHVDDLARFINPTSIVVAVEDDPKDQNYKILRENIKRCRLLKDQAGRPFDILEIPMPGVVEHDGQRLPATYVNFYFINGALLVPIYRHKANDRKALDILQKALPDHWVIGIDCVELIWGLGAIHCLTQQQPRF